RQGDLLNGSGHRTCSATGGRDLLSTSNPSQNLHPSSRSALPRRDPCLIRQGRMRFLAFLSSEPVDPDSAGNARW
ncbi:MAG: hypothetical protein Q8L76_14650, partial [Cypionkella sp.]|nr:hypothetical protein [Cypionkella sp.]